MKTQVDYEKIVLWSPSSDLKTTKTSLGDLALNFIKFKFEETSDREDEREVIGDVPDPPRVPQESDSESSDENADDDEQATPDPYVAETEIDTEDDEPIDDEQDFMTTWSKNLRGFPQIPPFTGASGIKVDLGDNPTAYNVYKQFLTLTDGIITHTKVDYL
ncbi:hypothetical protein BaRGS_00018048 [Batillaria attramentaria]|uniref:Uncharacterized protein n=1 Tax=Batillaria attramentaria TaxID=370345 RepID=A0ABD0KTM9_9CAEN